MKKKFYIASLVVLFLTANAFSQSAGFSEGAIGVNVGYTKLDMKDLKTYAEKLGITSLSSDYFLYGGEILGNLTPLFQMGVRYEYGSNEATAIVERIVTTSENNVETTKNYKLTRNFEHSISHFDLSINYKTSISGNLEYYISASAGLGKTGILISQDSGDQSFEDMINSMEPGSTENAYNRSIDFSAWLWAFEGQNGVRLHVRKGMAVSFNIGYQFGFTVGKGSINHDFENIPNLPDMDYKAVKYSLGLYFGN